MLCGSNNEKARRLAEGEGPLNGAGLRPTLPMAQP